MKIRKQLGERGSKEEVQEVVLILLDVYQNISMICTNFLKDFQKFWLNRVLQHHYRHNLQPLDCKLCGHDYR